MNDTPRTTSSWSDKTTEILEYDNTPRTDAVELNKRLIGLQDTLMKQALRLNAMQRVINELYLDTDRCADGAPDASAHDKLCNQISSALHPFIIKP